ncbi:deoxynucleoside triphosphate triphosphohydrolase SAMHD1-like [Latimeria chalumnae]|uniref:deoxynucleoside triphosphate triphosphohydrolase SAMHD1-like n=1 Tax=Latimeria chalumnae TaxID=7897 RepID=UPI00313BD3C8
MKAAGGELGRGKRDRDASLNRSGGGAEGPAVSSYETPEKRVREPGGLGATPEEIQDWDVEKVSDFLLEQGFGEFEKTFRENNITGSKLLCLTDTHLEKLGVTFVGKRVGLLYCIRQLNPIETMKVINDPIHGHIALHPLLIKIMDTPQFQRLRDIKQLGGAYYVFPGASHNRFEHSIGVAYLAGCLVRSLQEKQPELGIDHRDILCVQIAGLCHDLGHGPFSHLFDRKFIPQARPGLNWKHEDASVQMFDHLITSNGLKTSLEENGLILPEDITFIKKQIAGTIPKSGTQSPSSRSQSTWPDDGRPKEKSFLYEIIANERNGIDVDKWDYFARDCHHLGLQNNFDHKRFLQFARVVQLEDGLTTIGTRGKEVKNLYDLFHTRNCLHRKAYQHKVVKVIETMIAEAFQKADQHIVIKETKGKKFTISRAIDDMEAYTKLTDCIFYQILHSSSQELAEARKILENIIRRKLYKCVGQTHVKPENQLPPNKRTNLSAELAEAVPSPPPDVTLNAEDFVVDVIQMDYGMKDQNPINEVYFYSKLDPKTPRKIKSGGDKIGVSHFLPKNFAQQLIRAYCKKTDEQSLKAAEQYFTKWCRNKNFPDPVTIDAVTSELTAQSEQEEKDSQDSVGTERTTGFKAKTQLFKD